MRATSSLLATIIALPRSRAANLVLPLRAARAPPARASATDAASSSDEAHRISLTLDGPEDTLELGAKLASLARAGDAVLLHGDYGAGKTCLARGFLRHWYSDPSEQVTSPSYLIDNVYDDPDGRALLPGVTVHHMDLWRLPEGKISQLVDLPHVFGHCVSLIEWPERLTSELTPASHLDLRLDILDEGEEAMAPFERTAEERVVVDDGDDEDDEDDDTQPRVATLTAHGEAWVERLREFQEGI